MSDYSSDGVFVTILHPKYRKELIKALDDMAFWVDVPSYMAVAPSDSIFKKPFWTWLKESVIDYYDDHQEDIFDELGLRSDIGPQTLAWYCSLIMAFSMLKNSSSCHCNNDKQKLSQWGENIQSFIWKLGDYAIENNLATKAETTQIIADLLHIIPGSSIYTPQADSSPESKTPPSSPTPSSPLEDEHESAQYKNYTLPALDEPPIPQEKKHPTPSRQLILAVAAVLLMTGGLAFLVNLSNQNIASSSKATSPVSIPAPDNYKPTYNGISPLSKPKTGLFHGMHSSNAVAPFTVTASDNEDYYLLLCQNGKVAFGYYIHRGEILSVKVPLGSYDLYYACAPSSAYWYGEANLWGSETEFYKSSDEWNFSLEDGYYTGYTLSLTLTSNGNTGTYDSSRSTWNELFE